MAIRQKPKECIECHRMRLIFSHGRCKKCATTASVRVKSQMFRERKQDDIDFYMDVWLNRTSNKCQAVGCENIIHEPQLFNFHHLLEKSKFPLLRYDPDNIAILCWQCHNQIHTKPGIITCFERRIIELRQRIEN
jgi:hypothetical protein